MKLVGRSLREWPLLVAALAVASIPMLPRFARSEGLTAAAEREEIDRLRRLVEGSKPGLALDPLRGFLVRHPESPLAPEAYFLRGKAVVLEGRGGTFPGTLALGVAWSDLGRGRGLGWSRQETLALQREIAHFLFERDLAREAVEKMAELYRETRDPELSLDLARALARRSAQEPELRQALLDEAAARISDYLRYAPQQDRLRGFLMLSRIYWDVKRYDDMLPILDRELAGERTPLERGLLQLERGRALARMGRFADAFAALDEAERLVDDPSAQAAAMLFQAELFAREGKAACAEVCLRITAGGSRLAPLANLIMGVWMIDSRTDEAIESIRSGLAEIRRPYLLDEAGFDFGWVYSTLKTAWVREPDPERAGRFAVVYPEIERLFPRTPAYRLDHAQLLLKAHRPSEATAVLLETVESGLQEPADRDRTIRAAAEASEDAGLHAKAAALYRRYVDSRPEAHVAWRYRQAENLRHAGDLDEAMAVYQEYVARAGPEAPHAAHAVLHRAEILETLGRPEDAVAEFDRVLKAREVASDPGRDTWARALLGRGRALFAAGRLKEAQTSLKEYLERYAAENPGAGSMEAAWLLVRSSIRESDWRRGLERLAALHALAARLPEKERAPHEETLREARFMEGDFLFNLGDYSGAARAYGDAYRRHLTSEDRLWGLIGRGRALARLDRKEEARRDYSNARAIYEEGRSSYEKSLAGRGKEWWTGALDALAKDIK